VCETILEAVHASRAGQGSPREVVDLAFDTFDREGAGALTSWMLLTGNEDALDPIIRIIHELVDEIAPEETQQALEERRIHRETLSLVLMALGDALIGGALAKSLGLPRDAARVRAEAMLAQSLDGGRAGLIFLARQRSGLPRGQARRIERICPQMIHR
jgi:hypothetical protein